MLEFLRRQSQSWVVWVGLGLVSVVFIFFFGPQSMGIQPGAKSRAMSVNGTVVTNAELDARVQRLARFGQQIPDSMFYEVKREVAQDVAMTLVLAEHARKAGLRISDDELRCYIVDWNAGFRVDGDFICRQFPRSYKALYPNLDLPFYTEQDGTFAKRYGEQVRRWFGLSIEAYENYKRKELLAVRYLDVLGSGLAVTPEEAELRWRTANETVEAEFVKFDPAANAGEFSDEALASFKTEADSDVRAAYEARQEEFAVPRQIHLSRIYIRKPDAEQDAARARVDELLAQAQAEGADFTALVREHSENAAEVELDGDMGERPANLMAEEFVSAVDSLSEGEVALVEQNYAWSIIRLTSDREAGFRTYEEVSDDLARELLTERRADAARGEMAAHAEALLLAATQGDNARLDTALAAAGLEGFVVANTGRFSVEPQTPDLSGIDPQLLPYIRLATPEVGEIPGIGKDAALVGRLFGMTLDAPLVDEVVEVDGALFVVRLIETRRGMEPSGEDLANLQAVIQRERANALIGVDGVRGRILANTGAPLSSPIQSLIASAKIRYEEGVFTPPAGVEMLD